MAAISQQQLQALFTLMAVPQVGETRLRSLIDTFQSPENVLKATQAELAALPNISENLAEAIRTYRNQKWIDRQFSFMEKFGARVVTIWDAAYPTALRTIFDPPPVLFVKGDFLEQDTFAIGIVGTRKATHYGNQAARMLSADLAQRGITVVSGLARGIDTVAHQSALDAGGRTLAVLGCGLDTIYPPENRKLYEQIPNAGALISEYPFGIKPEPGNFPGRNRIISGLSLGVVVVEAGEQSGALLTATFAADQGREVFAVPGNINSTASRGPNLLIKNGAKIVTDVEDIINELRVLPQSIDRRKKLDKLPAPQLLPEEESVYAAISTEPIHIDALSETLRISTSELLGLLLQLELKGAVVQLPGKLFVVC